jgi:hypothetical protein
VLQDLKTTRRNIFRLVFFQYLRRSDFFMTHIKRSLYNMYILCTNAVIESQESGMRDNNAVMFALHWSTEDQARRKEDQTQTAVIASVDNARGSTTVLVHLNL